MNSFLIALNLHSGVWGGARPASLVFGMFWFSALINFLRAIRKCQLTKIWFVVSGWAEAIVSWCAGHHSYGSKVPTLKIYFSLLIESISFRFIIFKIKTNENFPINVKSRSGIFEFCILTSYIQGTERYLYYPTLPHIFRILDAILPYLTSYIQGTGRYTTLPNLLYSGYWTLYDPT